jgi:hypothetical protein
MRVAEKVTPVLGALTAIGTLACCLPLGGAALLGLGSIVGALASFQQWLLPAAAVLLASGGMQIWRSRRVCGRASRSSLAVLAISVAIVLIVLLFPQNVAGFLTDWLS